MYPLSFRYRARENGRDGRERNHYSLSMPCSLCRRKCTKPLHTFRSSSTGKKNYCRHSRVIGVFTKEKLLPKWNDASSFLSRWIRLAMKLKILTPRDILIVERLEGWRHWVACACLSKKGKKKRKLFSSRNSPFVLDNSFFQFLFLGSNNVLDLLCLIPFFKLDITVLKREK